MLQGPRKDLPVHHASSLAYHMQLQYDKFSLYQQEIGHLHQANSLLVQKCASLDSEVIALAALVRKMTQTCTWMETVQTHSEADSQSECFSGCSVAEKENLNELSHTKGRYYPPSVQSDCHDSRVCAIDKKLQMAEERLTSVDR